MSDETLNIAALKSATTATKLSKASAKKEATVDPKEQAKIEDAAEQFEALLVQQMFNSMWQAVPQEGLLSGSNEEALYRDMFNQALAESLSKNQSLGIKDVIMKEMQGSKK